MSSIIRFQKIFLFLSGIAFLFTNPVHGKEPDWFLKMKSVKIFQSSKQDIERIFDYPKAIYNSNENGQEQGWGEIIKYQTKDGKLEVFYSTGRCSENNNKDGWDVDEGVVISVEFEPNEPIKLAKLNLDLTTFVGEKESDNQNYNYRSSKLGIEFSTLGGKVNSFEYTLTAEMRKFDCKIVLKIDKSFTN